MSATAAPARAPVEDAQRPPRDRAWFVHHVLLRFAMVWVLIALAIASDLLYPGFFDWSNIKNILFQNAPVGTVALGMTFVIIAGGFDLSVGALFAGGAVLYTSFSNHMALALAFVATVAAGLGAGAINGVIIMKLKVNAFVATLGTASLFGGAVYMYSNSAPILAEKSSFQSFG